MLGDVAEVHGSVKARFEEAGEAIGVDLWGIAQRGQDADLASTTTAQPALLTASFALWEIWLRRGGARPRAMAGHSLGEYSALVCGGALTFVEAVRLVHRRGQLMQAAVPRGQGAMAAILGLDDRGCGSLLRCGCGGGVGSQLQCPRPDGHCRCRRIAVEQAVDRCRAAGARRAVLLEVSGPFHCKLMAPAGEQFAAGAGGGGDSLAGHRCRP